MGQLDAGLLEPVRMLQAASGLLEAEIEEFAPAALRVLSAIVLGFWLVHLVKNYMS